MVALEKRPRRRCGRRGDRVAILVLRTPPASRLAGEGDASSHTRQIIDAVARRLEATTETDRTRLAFPSGHRRAAARARSAWKRSPKTRTEGNADRALRCYGPALHYRTWTT